MSSESCRDTNRRLEGPIPRSLPCYLVGSGAPPMVMFPSSIKFPSSLFPSKLVDSWISRHLPVR